MAAGGSVTDPVPEAHRSGSCLCPLVAAAGPPAQCDSSAQVAIHAVASCAAGWGCAVAVSAAHGRARYEPLSGWQLVSRFNASPSAMLDVPRWMQLQLDFRQSQNQVFPLDSSGSRPPPAAGARRLCSVQFRFVFTQVQHMALTSETAGSISASLLAPQHRNSPSDRSHSFFILPNIAAVDHTCCFHEDSL